MEYLSDILDVSDSLDIRDYAFFFDIDGTLSEIKPRPQDVYLDVELIQALGTLLNVNPAMAIISGRPLHEIDYLIRPLKITVAGIHGAHIRYPNEMVEKYDVDDKIKSAVFEELQTLLSEYPDITIENKGIAYAIHYRKSPGIAPHVIFFVSSLVEKYSEFFKIQHGKCVCELMPKNIDKGSSLSKIMNVPLFRGKTPVYFGDDITDESAFAVVNEKGGISVKVGQGDTIARYRFLNVRETIDWIKCMALNEHNNLLV